MRFQKGTFCLADSGYQGIDELHSNALIPHKKPKKKDLTKPQKRYNRMLSLVRVKVENVLPLAEKDVTAKLKCPLFGAVFYSGWRLILAFFAGEVQVNYAASLSI